MHLNITLISPAVASRRECVAESRMGLYSVILTLISLALLSLCAISVVVEGLNYEPPDIDTEALTFDSGVDRAPVWSDEDLSATRAPSTTDLVRAEEREPSQWRRLSSGRRPSPGERAASRAHAQPRHQTRCGGSRGMFLFFVVVSRIKMN